MHKMEMVSLALFVVYFNYLFYEKNCVDFERQILVHKLRG